MGTVMHIRYVSVTKCVTEATSTRTDIFGLTVPTQCSRDHGADAAFLWIRGHRDWKLAWG